MKITSIKPSDIKEIALLHQKTLITPGSKIGLDYLTKLYQVLTEEDHHICLAAWEKDKVVAAITATLDLSQTNKILKKCSLPLALMILRSIILRKITFSELVNMIRFKISVLKKFGCPYPAILVLFVDKKYQRQGIGKKLIWECLKRMKQKKIKKVYVDTLIDNHQALGFYQSLGFKKKGAIADSYVLEYTK